MSEFNKPTIFIDTNEAQDQRNDYLMKPLRDYYGDRLIVAHQDLDFSFFAQGHKWLERKVCPGDLLSSISDGRLSRQCQLLASTGGYLLLEGKLEYSPDGRVLVGRRRQGYTRKQISGLLASIQQSGVTIMWSPSALDTPEIIHEAYNISAKTGHTFIGRRARPRLENGMAPTLAQKVLYAYQGQGSETLRRFLEMDEDELREIPGFGKARAYNVSKIADEAYKDQSKS
jgi:ERCC4-type nuclease